MEKNVRRLAYKFTSIKVCASHRTSTQMHTSPDQTVSVWPGLNAFTRFLLDDDNIMEGDK